jgi:hypothetical protein
MTFREKLAKEHPDKVESGIYGCEGCPGSHWFEYKDTLIAGLCIGGPSETNCEKCWNQEIPETTINEIRKETEGMEEKVIVSIEDAIENRIGQIHALEKDIKTLEARKKCDENAHILKMTFDSFVAAGFDEQQAWKLLMKLMEGAAKQIK